MSLPQPTTPTIDRPPKTWTVAEYHAMIAAGIFGAGERLELIAGEIIPMVPPEPPHASNTASFSTGLILKLGNRAMVRTQLPLTLGDRSEPEPDIAVVKPAGHRYRDRHPTAADVLLLVEVSDSTLAYDRQRKAQLYAEAGIEDYWVVAVPLGQVLVFREPQAGGYDQMQAFNATERLVPLAFPDVSLLLGDLLL